MKKEFKILKILGETLIELSNDLRGDDYDYSSKKILAKNFKSFDMVDVNTLNSFMYSIVDMLYSFKDLKSRKQLFLKENCL